MCTRRVSTNKQKVPLFFLRHFGPSILLEPLACSLKTFSPPTHNLRGGLNFGTEILDLILESLNLQGKQNGLFVVALATDVLV